MTARLDLLSRLIYKPRHSENLLHDDGGSMAGHSQFKNIMHRKGRQDAVRSKMFSKLAREITVAAKQGMPDPNMNPRLRLAIQNAKAESMPKDNIQRAINKASAATPRTTRKCATKAMARAASPSSSRR